LRKAELAVALLAVMVLTGCGGGGGGGGGSSSPPMIKGAALVDTGSQNLKIGMLRYDDEGVSTTMAVSDVEVPASSANWTEVPFGIIPPKVTESELFSVVLFGDDDKDGIYQEAEFKGLADGYLFWDKGTGHWQVWDSNGDLRWSDAFEHSGKENLYIEAQYRVRSKLILSRASPSRFFISLKIRLRFGKVKGECLKRLIQN